MISPRDIVTHLRTYLPAVTDLFHDTITTSSASVAGGVVSINAVGHGLIVGQTIIVVNGLYENSLDSVDFDEDTTTRFGTVDEHDLVAPTLPDDPQTVTLSGIGAPWDGEHQIDNIPNRNCFEIATPAGETIAPDISTGLLIEERSAGLGGLQTVATVPGVDDFTIDVPDTVPSLPTGNILQLEILTGVRVVGAADYARAEAVYAKQANTDPYLFVIMSDASASKDRHTNNDSIASFSAQDLQKQTILQNFTVACFIPTAEDDTAGFNAQSEAYNTIFQALLNVLYGFRFDDPTSAQQYVTVTVGHGPGINATNSAYYAHVYDWQIPTVITFEDGFSQAPTVAFRDIASTWGLFADDMAQLSVNVDLDAEAV